MLCRIMSRARLPVVPPPFEVQQCAWSCAFVLHQEWRAELAEGHRYYVEEVQRSHPDALGWRDLARVFGIYGETVDVRV